MFSSGKFGESKSHKKKKISANLVEKINQCIWFGIHLRCPPAGEECHSMLILAFMMFNRPKIKFIWRGRILQYLNAVWAKHKIKSVALGTSV